MAELEASGVQRVASEDQLTGQTFIVDTHFYDVLHFPNELLDMLEQHRLVAQCHLVLQVVALPSICPSVRPFPRHNENDRLYLNTINYTTSFLSLSYEKI